MHMWRVRRGEILCMSSQYKSEPSVVEVEMAIKKLKKSPSFWASTAK